MINVINTAQYYCKKKTTGKKGIGKKGIDQSEPMKTHTRAHAHTHVHTYAHIQNQQQNGISQGNSAIIKPAKGHIAYVYNKPISKRPHDVHSSYSFQS